jgi:hypothetical protein
MKLIFGLIPHLKNSIIKLIFALILPIKNKYLHHFLFLTASFVTYFALVLAFVVNTFFVSYFPTVANPCVLPAPFLPFFLYPFLCHFGSHLYGSALNPSVGCYMLFGYLGLLFFFILFFKA